MTLDDRYADICEPLFIVSDVTNVTAWQDGARSAALWFSEQRIEDEPSSGIKFLKEVFETFESRDRIFKNILEKEIGLDRNEFNKLRRRFDVLKDHTIRIADKSDKGWYKSDWSDVWKRYSIQTTSTPVDLSLTQTVTVYTPVTTDTLVTMVTEKEVEDMPATYEGKITPEVCKKIIEDLAPNGVVTTEMYQRRRKELGMPYNKEALNETA
jgi:hypothetical protein